MSALAPVLSVEITPSIDKMRVGETLTFSINVQLGEGVPPSSGGFPRWSSTNRAVVDIDAGGKATAISEGTATIDVGAHGQKTARNIEVTR